MIGIVRGMGGVRSVGRIIMRGARKRFVGSNYILFLPLKINPSPVSPERVSSHQHSFDFVSIS